MILLLQRVTKARVEVNTSCIAQIGNGILVLCGFEANDDQQTAARLLQKLLAYRVFSDDKGRMNRSVTDINGGVLLVPQFTLAAETTKGLRPSFSKAASPEVGQVLFKFTCNALQQQHSECAFGKFGADMQVSLINDGPVTFWLRARPREMQ